jgi:hypothetical protein
MVALRPAYPDVFVLEPGRDAGRGLRAVEEGWWPVIRTPLKRQAAHPRCRQCRERFTPARVGQQIHDDCAPAWGEAQRAKRLAREVKTERANLKARKAAIKKLPQLKAEAQKEFNAYIRERDRGQLCICCAQHLGAGAVGGGYDCGHYRSIGSAPHLRFDERNAHAQRKQCNRYGAGRAVDYRIGLIGRIGIASVEALEADNTVKKWTREELIAIKEHYRAKAKQLKEQ